jgi:hypothetical protein
MRQRLLVYFGLWNIWAKYLAHLLWSLLIQMHNYILVDYRAGFNVQYRRMGVVYKPEMGNVRIRYEEVV